MPSVLYFLLHLIAVKAKISLHLLKINYNKLDKLVIKI